MSTIHFPTKIFYMNGMTTNISDATECAQSIANKTGLPVDLIHNNTTSIERVIEASTKLMLGIMGISYAASSEKRSTTKKVVDTSIAIGSAYLIGSAVNEYVEIQKEKNLAARDLAHRVSAFLESYPLNEAALIVHSQGADIAHRALRLLVDYRDQIRVITIGGMVPIPDHLAGEILNVQSLDDYVSRFAQSFFGSALSGHGSKLMINGTGHGAQNYLDHPLVSHGVKVLTGPTCYVDRNARMASRSERGA